MSSYQCKKHEPPVEMVNCPKCGELSRCPACGCWRTKTGFCVGFIRGNGVDYHPENDR